MADSINVEATEPESEFAMLVTALRRIARDNYITSGSFGPLMDVGFGYGWSAAQMIAQEALTTAGLTFETEAFNSTPDPAPDKQD